MTTSIKLIMVAMSSLAILSCSSDTTIDSEQVPILTATGKSLILNNYTTIRLTNTGGVGISSCTIKPKLPTGLSISVTSDKSSCQITGTPTVESEQESYTITAINSRGSNTTQLVLGVQFSSIHNIQITGNDNPLVGESLILKAIITPEHASNQVLEWASQDESVATVDNNGVVTAISVGNVVITATATDGSEVTAGFSMIIKPIQITQIAISGKTSLIIDRTTQLTATITPSNATNKKLAWSSNDNSVAQVDSDGVVTAISVGNVVITATATDGSLIAKDFAIDITINPPKLLTISSQTAKINTATAITIINTGGILDSCTVNPTLPDNLTINVHNNNCYITGIPIIEQETRTYTVTANNSANSSSVKLNLSVKEEMATPKLITVILLDGMSNITIGNTTQLTTTITPTDATNQQLAWGSSNEEIATVLDGLVTALSVGSATITAAATDGSGITAIFAVIVEPKYVEVMVINGMSNITVGDTTQLTTIITPNDATIQRLAWSSSNEEIATVLDGLVTALSVGSATITAAATDGSGITATFNVIVEPRYATDIIITGHNIITIDETTQLNAKIIPDNATSKEVIWSSSNEEIATITNDGRVTGVNLGTTTITATANDGSQIVQEFVLSVAEEVLIEEINIYGDNFVNTDQTIIFNASIEPTNATNKDLSWSSQNENIATVTNDGRVTGVNLGTTTITASANDGSNISNEFTITVAKLPYFELWHIKNTGQNAYSKNSGTAGEDINYNFSFGTPTGRGVVVAVIDDGMEINHEDLSVNVIPNGSKDFVHDDNDPTITDFYQLEKGDHGTAVAGVIGALDNDLGGYGIAPNVGLKGFNFLRKQSVENLISAIGGAEYSANVDIFNQSFGQDNTGNARILPSIKEAYEYGVQSLRDGKGAIYVKAAGNGFFGFSDDTRFICAFFNPINVSCQNANMDPTNTLPSNIVVAAVNANGIKSSYSTAGSSLWVSAPGGEDGDQNPAIITTDHSGCLLGYSTKEATTNDFDNNKNKLNPNCNYTAAFRGTSAAAPVVSGVIALMLEANPELTWRDVKHILATTSSKVDEEIEDITIDIDGSSFVIEPGWLTNAAGYNFHNYYGFGRIDAGKAVDMAFTYNTNLGNFSTFASPKISVDNNIPDFSHLGTTDTISINQADNLTIEAVEVDIQIKHDYMIEISIELISPSGTRSILFHPYNSFISGESNFSMVLLSNAFYGESMNGDWTIKIVDISNGDEGVLESWKITFFGH